MTTRSRPCTYAPAGGEAAPPDLPSVVAVLGRAGRENFKVASRLLPSSARRHLLAFYGYARLVDQLGDAYGGDRLAALDWVEHECRRALAGCAGTHPLVEAAAASVNTLGLDPQPLFDLVEANRMDQTRSSYCDFDDLVGYCRLSAVPVGRLVLGLFGYRDASLTELSDALCTGLQLVEHWQDVGEDARAGRVYIPEADLVRFGVDRAELTGHGPASPRLRALMVFEVARARDWLDRGAPLLRHLSAWPRLAVAGFLAGGQSALDAIADRDFDPLAPPEPRPVIRTTALTVLRAIGR